MQTESSIIGTGRPSVAAKLFSLVAGGGLCLLVVLLALQNRQLEATLAEVSLRAASGGLQEGDVIPPLELVDLGGSRETKEWSGDRSSLLFFFTTTCSACEQNLDRWKDAYSRYSNELEIIAVGLDSLGAVRAYAQE